MRAHKPTSRNPEDKNSGMAAMSRWIQPIDVCQRRNMQWSRKRGERMNYY